MTSEVLSNSIFQFYKRKDLKKVLFFAVKLQCMLACQSFPLRPVDVLNRAASPASPAKRFPVTGFAPMVSSPLHKCFSIFLNIKLILQALGRFYKYATLWNKNFITKMVKRHTKTSGKTFLWSLGHFFQYICDNSFMQR